MANSLLQGGDPQSWRHQVICSDPAAPVKYNPVRFGYMTGVALHAEGAGGVSAATLTLVDFGPSLWDLAVHDEVGGGIALGDPLFYGDAQLVLTNNPTATYFFGFALEIVSAVVHADTINVLHVPSPGAGTLGTGTVGGSNLAPGILSADATGRALVATGWLDVATALAAFDTDSVRNAWLLKAIQNGAFSADAATRALFGAIWTSAQCAAGLLSADATGRALVATNFLDLATALALFGTDTIDNTWLLKAVTNASFLADAGTRALFAAGIWTGTYIAADTLTTAKVVETASADVLGCIPILYHRTLAAGAVGSVDIVVTNKFRVTDVWIVLKSAGILNCTCQVFNAGNAISDAMAAGGSDGAIVRAVSLVTARCEIADTGTLRITTATGATQPDIDVYVSGIRLA